MKGQKFILRNGNPMSKEKVTGWYCEETIGIGLEHLITCPVHGVVAATGAIRGPDGLMLCLQCNAVKGSKT